MFPIGPKGISLMTYLGIGSEIDQAHDLELDFYLMGA
jgi:hypothetical protein